MRPLRYSLNVTLDGCYDHTVGIADEERPQRDGVHRRVRRLALRTCDL